MTNNPIHPGSFTTTSTGTPVASDDHSLTIGADGPIVLHDAYAVEKLAQFNRERVPERVVHATVCCLVMRCRIGRWVSAL